MNRGSEQVGDRPVCIRHRFNEAPIHESGKYPESQPRKAALYGFNEAPIHESGKSQCSSVLDPCFPLASMRPRFMNRGSITPGLGSGLLGAASMRPRFMNRGSEAPLEGRRAGSRLQ